MLFTQEEKSFLSGALLECRFDEANIEDRENSGTFSYLPSNPKDGERVNEFLAKFPRWERVRETAPNPRKFVQLALKQQG